ncbi:MAG: HD domain-containing protein [Lachnospiraceae bacterium]|nr:HD domain-containing protein [Lachnospiraceae bacterium]
MSRLKELRKYVDAELNKMEDADKRSGAIAHLYGVSLAATMIAKKRGLDPEIASMAAMLHDLNAYKTGSYDDHAHKGADLAREILGELKLTDETETEIICSAIYHHDDKLVTDDPMDEVLKDADVIDHCFKDSSKPVKEKEQARYDKLCAEFGI